MADSRGGGKIRCGNAGSKKQTNWWWCCLLLENRHDHGWGGGGSGREGKMYELKSCELREVCRGVAPGWMGAQTTGRLGEGSGV